VVGNAGPDILGPLEGVGVAEAGGPNLGARCLEKFASAVEEATRPEPEDLDELLGSDRESPIGDDAIGELCNRAAPSFELAHPSTGEPAPPDLLIVADAGEIAHRSHSSHLDQHASEVEEDIVEVGHLLVESNSVGSRPGRPPCNTSGEIDCGNAAGGTDAVRSWILMPLLLCDLDDTLLDRRAIFAEWATDYAAVRGLDEMFVKWVIEQDGEGYSPREDLWAAVKERLALLESVDQLISDYRQSFVGFMRCTDSVVDALARVREAGWAIAIVTNGDAYQQQKIDHSRLDSLVDAVCISGLEGTRKPDPRIFELAAGRCGATLQDAWMIGDNSETDIAGASACNINSFWLANGRTWPASLDFHPTRAVDSFAEAVDFLLRS
jgi:HAD superfamily hydrolase (TIGR01549 family)